MRYSRETKPIIIIGGDCSFSMVSKNANILDASWLFLNYKSRLDRIFAFKQKVYKNVILNPIREK
tara:strand:+ start:376 stop:570 length:195 start_codon:yes stop_codon:yes gene_type:complete